MNVKNYILLILFSLIVYSCHQNNFSDPVEYNENIAKLVIQVQNPFDSLEAELLFLKQKLEKDSAKIFNLSNDVDIEMIYNLIDNAGNQINTSKIIIKKISYKKGDEFFKSSVVKSLELMEKSLNNDFIPLVHVLQNSDNKTNHSVLVEIIPYGLSGFKNYQAAIDSCVNGQQKFNAQHNYIIDDYLLRFNF